MPRPSAQFGLFARKSDRSFFAATAGAGSRRAMTVLGAGGASTWDPATLASSFFAQPLNTNSPTITNALRMFASFRFVLKIGTPREAWGGSRSHRESIVTRARRGMTARPWFTAASPKGFANDRTGGTLRMHARHSPKRRESPDAALGLRKPRGGTRCENRLSVRPSGRGAPRQAPR